MNKKIRLSRKTLKIILAVCLTAAVAITTGFFIYIYVVDKNTLGREIRIYQQEVSGLTVDEAQKKIMDAFNSRELTFYEDGKEVYRTSMKELGYSLDENVLNAQLTAIKQERDAEKQIIAQPVNFRIGYQIQKDQEKEKAALSASHFNNKERTASVSASISYEEQKQQFVMVKDVQGDQIDEGRLISHVDQILDTTFPEDLLGSEIKIEMGPSVYVQPETVVTDELQKKLDSLNGQLKKYRSTTVTYTFGPATEVLDSAAISSWIKIEGEKISIDEAAAGQKINRRKLDNGRSNYGKEE